MGSITLKDYFDKLDEIKRTVDLRISKTLSKYHLDFSFENISVIETTLVDENDLSFKLLMYKCKGITKVPKKNYITEIYKMGDEINQIVYAEDHLWAGGSFEDVKFPVEALEELAKIMWEYDEYFGTSLNKENMLLSLKGKTVTDELLKSITLDEDKLPSFARFSEEGKKHR